MVCKVSIFTQLFVVFLFLDEQIHLIFIFAFIGLKVCFDFNFVFVEMNEMLEKIS